VAVFTDGLDGTPATTLRTRTGWSRPAGADEATLVSGGSGFSLTGGTAAASGTWHAPTSQPSSADQYCEAILPTVAQIGFPLGVRCDTTNSLGAGYVLRYNGPLQLFRRSAAGGLTSIGSYTVPTPADLATNPVRLEAIGTAIKVYFKGAAVISVTDANIASGSVAMLSRGGSSSTANDVDNWQSGEAGAPSNTTSTVTVGVVQATGCVVNTALAHSVTAAQVNVSGLTVAVRIAAIIAVIAASFLAIGKLIGTNTSSGGTGFVNVRGRLIGDAPTGIAGFIRGLGLSLGLGL